MVDALAFHKDISMAVEMVLGPEIEATSISALTTACKQNPHTWLGHCSRCYWHERIVTESLICMQTCAYQCFRILAGCVSSRNRLSLTPHLVYISQSHLLNAVADPAVSFAARYLLHRNISAQICSLDMRTSTRINVNADDPDDSQDRVISIAHRMVLRDKT